MENHMHILQVQDRLVIMVENAGHALVFNLSEDEMMILRDYFFLLREEGLYDHSTETPFLIKGLIANISKLLSKQKIS